MKFIATIVSNLKWNVSVFYLWNWLAVGWGEKTAVHFSQKTLFRLFVLMNERRLVLIDWFRHYFQFFLWFRHGLAIAFLPWKLPRSHGYFVNVLWGFRRLIFIHWMVHMMALDSWLVNCWNVRIDWRILHACVSTRHSLKLWACWKHGMNCGFE